MKQGIDVSKWQPQIDWQKVKADANFQAKNASLNNWIALCRMDS